MANPWEEYAPASDAPGPWADYGAHTPEDKETVAGFGHNVISSAGHYASDLVNVAHHPIDALTGLAKLGVGMIASSSPVTSEQFPEQAAIAQAFGNHFKDKYGSWEDIKKTAYEDPVGFAADASVVLDGLGAGLKLAGAGRAAKIAESASAATNPLEIAGGAVRGAKALAQKAGLPERMYQSALKPPLSAGDSKALVQTGLREGIPVSPGGLEKTQAAIDAIDANTAATIQQGAAAGATVDPAAVAAKTARSRDLFANQVNPLADLKAVDSATDEFLNLNPNPIPVDQAQKMKQGTYGKLRNSYGEITGASREAQKDLARGIKEEIYSQFPELQAAGKREKELIDLDGALERYAHRFGNRDLVGIGTPITGGAVAAATGDLSLAAIAALAKSALDNPFIKSKLAIALAKKSGRGVAPRIANPIVRLNPDDPYSLPPPQ